MIFRLKNYLQRFTEYILKLLRQQYLHVILSVRPDVDEEKRDDEVKSKLPCAAWQI